MEQIRNVVVFGDSLSDIGVKWTTAMGRFAREIGEMTVNPSGRFSDCRNWTDFMYKEASGVELVTGGAKETIAASQIHLKLTKNSKWQNSSIGAAKTFLYANYAEGGACGGIPASTGMKLALGQFKDQARKFQSDWETLKAPDNAKLSLFLVWFGANDLYTAGCAPTAMGGVAEKVANKRRHEISRIVGARNARFIFMNLARPEAAVRYQEELAQQAGTFKDRFKKRFLGGGIEKQLDDFRRGADLYNERLLYFAAQNGDAVVDIASVVNPEVVNSSLKALGLIGGAQKAVKEKRRTHIPGEVYDNPVLAKKFIGKTNVTTSDKAHPTDRVYKLFWDRIKFTILLKQYAFGLLGS
jgi:hypothetical protein